MREAGGLAAQLEWAHGALGPEAEDLAEPSAELAEIGLDPLAADEIVAVTSNYPSSVRFDGVDPDGAVEEDAVGVGGAARARIADGRPSTSATSGRSPWIPPPSPSARSGPGRRPSRAASSSRAPTSTART